MCSPSCKYLQDLGPVFVLGDAIFFLRRMLARATPPHMLLSGFAEEVQKIVSCKSVSEHIRSMQEINSNHELGACKSSTKWPSITVGSDASDNEDFEKQHDLGPY